MADMDREVLREFLVALGFQIDEPSAKKFVGSLLGVSKLATQVSGTIAGVAVAAEAMVQIFASQMEKLYYASKRTGASAENIQALEFAARQVGLSSETARGALESMSRALRLNPGMVAFMNSLGVKTEGRDRLYVLNDFVKTLGKFPPFVAAQWAEQFGIAADDLLLLQQQLPELIAAEEKRRQLNRDAGVDVNKASEASKEYMNSLRLLWAQVEVLGNSLAVDLMPYFREFIGVASEVLKDVTKLSQAFLNGKLDTGDWGKQLKDITDDLTKFEEKTQAVHALLWLLWNIIKELGHAGLDFGGLLSSMLVGDRQKAQSKFQDLLLDLMSTLNPELDPRNNPTINAAPNRAPGNGAPPTGLKYTPAQQRALDVASIPLLEDELAKSTDPAERASLQRVISARKAAIDPALGGSRPLVPHGTRLLRDEVNSGGLPTGGAQLNQTTNITVNGSDNPEATAKAIGREQQRVLGDAVRNLGGQFR